MGSNYTQVSFELAREFQSTFVNGFEYRVQRSGSLRFPGVDDSIEVPDWNSIRHDETALLLPQKLVTGGPRPRGSSRGAATVYYLPADSVSQRIIGLGVVCIQRSRPLSQQFFDSSPISQAEVGEVFHLAQQLAAARNCNLVLGLASSTGFEKSAESAIGESSGVGAFLHPQVSVCLVDLQNGGFICNPADRALQMALTYFVGEIDEENQAHIENQIRESLFPGHRLTRGDLAKVFGQRMDVISSVFLKLASSAEFAIGFDNIDGCFIFKR